MRGILGALLFIGATPFLIFWVYHRNSSWPLASVPVILAHPVTLAVPADPRCEKTVILLQASPVLQKEQVKRLRSIDVSWAQWTDSHDVHILAAISNPSLFPEVFEKPFVNVEPLLLSLVKGVHNPFYNLVQSFLALTLHKRQANLKWLLYGNDHSFIISSNLQSFVSTLDSSQLIYTGNKLEMNNGQSFASGGGGVVISHTCLKVLVLIWSSLQYDAVILSKFFPNPNPSNSSKVDSNLINRYRNGTDVTTEIDMRGSTRDSEDVSLMMTYTIRELQILLSVSSPCTEGSKVTPTPIPLPLPHSHTSPPPRPSPTPIPLPLLFPPPLPYLSPSSSPCLPS